MFSLVKSSFRLKTILTRRACLVSKFSTQNSSRSSLKVGSSFPKEAASFDYFDVYQKGIESKDIKYSKLKAIKSEGHDIRHTKCHIVSVPFGEDLESFDLQKLINKYCPDVIFLQVDPHLYNTRRKQIIMKNKEIFLKDANKNMINSIIDKDDEFKVPSTDDLIVNPIFLDPSKLKKAAEQLERVKEGTTNEEMLQNESNEEDKTREINNIIQLVDRYILPESDTDPVDYPIIKRILYESLIENETVFLGDLTEYTIRMILCNSLDLSRLKEIFSLCLQKVEEFGGECDFRFIANSFLSYQLNYHRDIYMTLMLKQLMRNYNSVLAFVGAPNYEAIQHIWESNDENYKDLTIDNCVKIPKRKLNDSDSDLIHKHALLDAMFCTDLWNEQKLFNPFPYLNYKFESLKRDDLSNFKTVYIRHQKLYNGIKAKVYEKFSKV